MDKLDWTLIGLSSASVLGFSWLLSRSSVESRLHVLNDRKFVDADPAGLARSTGVPLDVYALASAMQSEEKTRIGRIAIGCAIRNFCRRHRVSVSGQLLKAIDKHGKKRIGHGYFGSQELPGKWAATSKAPTADTLILAAQILAKQSPIIDPTQGATAWDAPELQDRKHREDPITYTKDSKQVAADRTAAGGRMVAVDGIPHTRFWVFA
jgi:hypothetical protein